MPMSEMQQQAAMDQHPFQTALKRATIDNPISGCLSCHGTAQDPAAPGFINNACATDRQKMYWFRTYTGNQFFGAVDSTCTPTPVNPGTTRALDFSLQLSVSVQNVHQYNSANPCPGFTPAPGAATLSRISVCCLGWRRPRDGRGVLDGAASGVFPFG